MKTEKLVEGLRGYARCLEDRDISAFYIDKAADTLERTDKNMRVARAERDRARERLARANAQIEALTDRIRELEGKDG